MAPPFDFPSAPALSEEYTTSNNITYVWDGFVWNIKPAADMISTDYVLKIGDTMSGQLETIPPIGLFDATNKEYVDSAIAAQSLYQGVWLPATNVPDLTPAVANPLHSYSWVAQVLDPSGIEVPPAGLPGLSGVNISSADTIIWNDTLATYEIVRSPAAASGFLPITGGTITGDLAVEGETTLTGVLTIDGVTNPTIALNNPSGANNRIEGRRSGIVRWTLDLGGAAAENASNAGSDLVIYRFVNDGSTYTRAMQINRSDGFMSLTSGVGFGSVAQPAASLKDLSKHISLYGGAAGTFGFNITGSTLNYHVSTGSKHDFHVDGVNKLSVQTTTSYLNTNLYCTGQIRNGALHIRCTQTEGYGIEFFGGAFLYKRSGHSLVFRKQASNTPIRIEDNNGGGIVNIATTAMTTELTVEELITESVTPLLDRITKLETEIASLTRRT